MLEVGRIFIDKGENAKWEVIEIDLMEGITIQNGIHILNVDHQAELIFPYRKYKNGKTSGIGWRFSFGELDIIQEIRNSIPELIKAGKL